MPKQERTPKQNHEFSKAKVAEMVRLGKVDILRKAVLEGKIKIPQGLMNLNGRNGNALHIAAASGQVEMMQFLVSDLRYPATEMVDGKRVSKMEDGKPVIKLFGFDPSMRDDNGETAKDIVRSYGRRGIVTDFLKGAARYTKSQSLIGAANYTEQKISWASSRQNLAKYYMQGFLKALEYPAESSEREGALARVAAQIIPANVMPKRNEDTREPWGNMNTYTGRSDGRGGVLDSAKLHMELLKEVIEKAKERREEREKKDGVKRVFLDKAGNGTLTEDDLREFVQGGGKIDCLSGREGDNAMHAAVAGGHENIVKILLQGVNTIVNGEVKTVKLDFDNKAIEIMNAALAKDPNNRARQNIVKQAYEPSNSFVPTGGRPLGANPQQHSAAPSGP